jgi:hypothetical protein
MPGVNKDGITTVADHFARTSLYFICCMHEGLIHTILLRFILLSRGGGIHESVIASL